jgi:hypothetical protein
MVAPFNRDRSRRGARFGLPLVALVAIAVALLVPTLGTARSQTKPVNTAEPQISGLAAEGQTLTATTGSWTGTQPITYDYNWRRCPVDGGDGFGANCDGIVNHVSNTYTLVGADVGFTIRVRVKATNGDGSGDYSKKASNPTAVVTGTGGTAAAPANTAPPTVSGTPRVGQTVNASPGTWTGTAPISYTYDWLRCDQTGNACATFGATTVGHLLGAADLGARLRVRVTATNSSGPVQATSAPTDVITNATPSPPATGCPASHGAVQVAAVTPPARLVIDQQAAQSVLGRGSGQVVVVRYHVSDTCGRSVEGALVYATAVPFGQLSNPGEQPTGATGSVNLTFRTLAGFPLSPNQRRVAIFVRARKQGENLLTGISARRLFAIPLSR